MIELTRDDLVAIRSALGERYPIDERDQAIYRAGLEAGIERAAKVCEARTDPDSEKHGIMSMEAIHCAADIRALLK
jgi:hypothetical protein